MNDSHSVSLDLSPKKRELLKELLRRKGIGSATVRRIPVRTDGAPIPLSFSQERLWVLDQFDPNSPAYNVPGAFRFQGEVNIALLERSINEIVQRHEVLRTTFTVLDGGPVQIIASDLKVPLPVIDLRRYPVAERETELRRLFVEDAQRPFSLKEGPMFRASLIRVDAQDQVLLLNMHHIVSDAWSMRVFFSELTTLYEAFGRGTPSPLPELPIQYADFAVWQRGWLKGEVLERHLAYWRERLEGAAPVLELPADQARPAVQSFRGSIHNFSLPQTLAADLRALSRQENVTLFMTTLAAFQVLLHRYTGREDIIVGSPIANRGRTEIEGLIGFFLNTLVLRTDLSGNPTFRNLLQQVREVTLGGYAHQDMPFEKLVEELQPERSLSHNPLFQVMFTLQTASPTEAGGADGDAGALEIITGTAKFDLTLSIVDTTQAMSGSFEYSTDLFDLTTIERMTTHLQALLEGICQDPGQHIAGLALMPAEERQVLAKWNATEKDYPSQECVHKLFEARAAANPNKIAVLFGGTHISYRQLDERANQLAQYLSKTGIGPEARVAVCMERSVESVVALLGVLKAGGVYLPMDPGYPAQRLAFMLEDAGVSKILTQQRFANLFVNYDIHVICVDTAWDTIALEDATGPEPVLSTDNLAYAIYTSGSTGKPKGVVLAHRPLVNLISWQNELSAAPGPLQTLQFSSLTFDVSLQEMFATWHAGGTLVIIMDEERRDIPRLVRNLTELNIERIFLPYVALKQLADTCAATGQLPENLKHVITAGEQLQITPAIGELFSRLPGCTLHNQYGPSETHIVSECTLNGPTTTWPLLPPIGRPISNTRFYVLDVWLQPQPIGVPGELCIGGDCLARGYLDRRSATAEKFVPDPFGEEPGGRLYKTGDLARYLPDGKIEFLGRMDKQVKVRGFRIEPGEIEAVLVEHPAVQEAVIAAHVDRRGDKRLVAYVVPGTDHAALVSELKRFLRAKLPDYMIPASFMLIESMPLTASGKINRLALPEPDGERPDMDNAFVAPRDDTEQALAKIWVNLLELDRVGIHDNFFELGGHSLLATQAISRVREVLNVELPLRYIFENPTIASFVMALPQDATTPLDEAQMAELLAEIEGLSEDDVRAIMDENA